MSDTPLFQVKYEGPTAIHDDGTEVLLAAGARLRRVKVDYEAAAAALWALMALKDDLSWENLDPQTKQMAIDEAREYVNAALALETPVD